MTKSGVLNVAKHFVGDLTSHIFPEGDDPTSILSHATYHRAPSYDGVRTWVEDLLACGERTLAEASKLMG